MDTPSVGLVGARRRRTGLGPFLARFLEAAGMRITAVAGASRERAEDAARELGADLGHAIDAFGDAADLCGSGVDAVVIASPARHHLEALQAALAAGVPTLCEKPLVLAAQREAGERVVAGYRARDLVLVENCPWPNALPALWELHPGLHGGPVTEVSMGLSPSSPGKAMVEDSLSHFLSVLQALLPVGPDTVVENVSFDAEPDGRAVELRLTLRGAFPPVRGRLELALCTSQPRPAWIAVNGRRMDRRIQGPGYRIAFEGAGRTIPIDDPMATLVYGFAPLIREPDIERVRTEAATVAERLRLYCEILACWDHQAG